MPKPKHPTESPLCIIAGSGALPRMVVDAALEQGRSVFVILIAGHAWTDHYQDVPHSVFRLGAIGAMLKAARRVQARELVMAGAICRPSLVALCPDRGSWRYLAKIGLNVLSDDALLRCIITVLEQEGFHVLAVSDIVTHSVAQPGVYGCYAPNNDDKCDIERGFEIAQILGRVDVGQSVVVQRGIVLGVEAAEGTDALLERVGKLKQPGPGGVLVKVCKPIQDHRADLPTIGPQTVKMASQAGLVGIALDAGRTLIIDAGEIVRCANSCRLFVTACSIPEKGPV